MKNNKIRKTLIVIGILTVIFLLSNIGINLWLKYKLPDYVKNNSDYKIAYKSLNVSVLTGNISATEISVNTKNPQNQNVIGLTGTLARLEVSRLGIYDALFNKRINTSDLQMVNPDLNVVLAKPIDDRTGRKRSPFVFSNIEIENGNIRIFRHTKQKFIEVQDLKLKVENLQMTEESVESRLPVVFDKYDISGKNFYFRPDDVYGLTADIITTENGLMNIKNFKVTLLLSPAQAFRSNPARNALYDFKAREMDFKDVLLVKNRISLSNFSVSNPDLKVYTSPTARKNKKKFNYEVNLEDIVLDNAHVEILKSNGSRIFNARNMNINIHKFLMDEETSQGNIPFSYEKFALAGKDVNYATGSHMIAAADVSIRPEKADIRNFSVKSSGSGSTQANLSISHVAVALDYWEYKDSKLKLNAQSVLINNLRGTLNTTPSKDVKKAAYDWISFPLTLKKMQVISPHFTLTSQGRTTAYTNLNLKAQNIVMDAETAKAPVPFKARNYSLTVSSFSRRLNEFYSLSTGLMKLQPKNMVINNLVINPTVSRSQFIRMIPAEKDLYDIKVQQMTASGDWDLISADKHLYADAVTLTGMNANIFRSKVPKDDLTRKPMYTELLRKIKFPLEIKTLDVKNSVLVYEEDTKQSEGPGKLTFGSFNLNARNLNSAKPKGKSTKIPITVRCSFMNASPMNVRWTMDTASQNDAFSIAGNISDLPAARINAFIEPYLKARATGTIQDLVFNFQGNASGLNGTLNMKHQDLQVSLLKETGEKKKLLSAVVNVFVKSNSGVFPASVVVDDVKRNPTKSFFNLFWQGIQEGLKKTLIGANVENTEKTLRNTVKDTKATVEETKTSVKTKVENVKEKIKKDEEAPAKKEGLLNRIFKKKEEPK